MSAAGAAPRSLVALRTSVAVSSVLGQRTSAYGPDHLFDGDDATCWTSDRGAQQFVDVAFAAPVLVRRVLLSFQGGFAATVRKRASERVTRIGIEREGDG
jgi:hypothetical protein